MTTTSTSVGTSPTALMTCVSAAEAEATVKRLRLWYVSALIPAGLMHLTPGDRLGAAVETIIPDRRGTTVSPSERNRYGAWPLACRVRKAVGRRWVKILLGSQPQTALYTTAS